MKVKFDLLHAGVDFTYPDNPSERKVARCEGNRRSSNHCHGSMVHSHGDISSMEKGVSINDTHTWHR